MCAVLTVDCIIGITSRPTILGMVLGLTRNVDLARRDLLHKANMTTIITTVTNALIAMIAMSTDGVLLLLADEAPV